LALLYFHHIKPGLSELVTANIDGQRIFFASDVNWWGTANGPSPIGSGDAISYHTDSVTGVRVYDVDADPWLTSAPF